QFERGEINAIVEHFALRTTGPPGHITYAFSGDNLYASGLKVTSERRSSLRDYNWDVYRFRNAATGDWLTACVEREASDTEVYLRILKGEALPNASFAYFGHELI
ncbi:hypothetical protein AAVH_43494, partial [Aphelenchoides avenae]